MKESSNTERVKPNLTMESQMNKLPEPPIGAWHKWLAEAKPGHPNPEWPPLVRAFYDDLIETMEAYRGRLCPDVAARVLGISVETLRRWRKLGIGPEPQVKDGQVFYDSRETTFYAHYRDGLPEGFGWLS